jgi:hypothetical protein
MVVVSLCCFLVALTAQAQTVDPEAVEDIASALTKFEAGAWLFGVAVAARVLTSIVKGFSPLWKLTETKPYLKWIYPSTIALLTALATAPFITTNPIVVVVASIGSAALSGFAAIGWYHGPTWIGGDPMKHAVAKPTTKLPQE